MQGTMDFLDNYLNRPRPSLANILNNPNETGVEQFLTAIEEGNLEQAKQIYMRKNIGPNAYGLSNNGECAIHFAARKGHIDCIKFLLEQGADVNIKERRSKTALHMAAGIGHLETVKLLIKNNACLDALDKYGRTPLMWAISIGSEDLVREFLQAGSSIKSHGNWHPIHEACKHGFLEIIKMLIEQGASVNNPSQFTGCIPWSPLHVATRSGHLDCINLLLDAGADVHCKNAGGHTSLHEAAYRGFTEITNRFLHQNANPNGRSDQKRTPLHEACQQGKVLSAVLLLDAGSKPDAQDMILDTPLHLALRARHPPPTAIALMTLLLQNGASPSIKGNNDETPFKIIKDSGQTECMHILMEALDNPLTLMQVCKVCIRRKLKFMKDSDRVNRLPLPSSVKNYLVEDCEIEGEEGLNI